MNPIIRRTSVAVVCWLWLASVNAKEIDPALLKQFQEEAPAAWKKQVELYNKFFSNTTGVTLNSKQHVVEDGGKKVYDDEYQEKRIRSTYRLLVTNRLTKGRRTVACVNPSYAFELEASAKGDWVITGIYPYSPPANDEKTKEDYNRILEPPREIRPHMLPFQGTLNRVEWLSDQVDVKGIKLVSVEGRQCVEVKVEFPFTYYKEKSPGSREHFAAVDRYTAVGTFDPSKQWVLVSFEWLGEPPWKMTEAYTYDEDHGGVPWRTSTRNRYSNVTDDGTRSEYSYEESLFVADLSERDFTLSAFGFPEPVLSEPNYWLYTSLGGIVLVFVGAGLYRWGATIRDR